MLYCVLMCVKLGGFMSQRVKTRLEACRVTERCGLPRQEVLGGKINQQESLAGAANAI